MVFCKVYAAKKGPKESMAFAVTLPPAYTQFHTVEKGEELRCHIDGSALIYTKYPKSPGVFIRNYKVRQCGHRGLDVPVPPQFRDGFGVEKGTKLECFLTNTEVIYRIKENK